MRAALLTVPLLLAGCLKDHPRVTYAELQSEAEGRPMTYAVYTPPGWDGVTPLPLVVFLHGGGDDEKVLEKKAMVPRRLDQWIEDGLLPPFLMVAPDGERGFWRNWADGSHRYADYVMDEVVPAMQAAYPVIAEADGGLHMMGISMGGAGTLFLGLDHLDRLASMSVWSAPIFTAEKMKEFSEGRIAQSFLPVDRVFGELTMDRLERESPYARIAAPGDLRGTRFLLGMGTVDIFGIPKATRLFQAHLAERGVPHTYVEYKGGHRYADWSRVFPVALCLHLTDGACDLPPSRFYAIDTVASGPAPGAAASTR